MTFSDWLNLLIPYVAPIIFAVAGTAGVITYQHLLKYLPDKQRATLEYAVNTAVTAVEQTMGDAHNQDKKAEAMQKATEMLAHFGLNIPSSVIDSCIESAVSAMNNAASQVTTQPAVTPAPQVAVSA